MTDEGTEPTKERDEKPYGWLGRKMTPEMARNLAWEGAYGAGLIKQRMLPEPKSVEVQEFIAKMEAEKRAKDRTLWSLEEVINGGPGEVGGSKGMKKSGGGTSQASEEDRARWVAIAEGRIPLGG